MRWLILIAVVLASTASGLTLRAQDVDILSISDASYPIMRADVMFFDASNMPVSAAAGEVTLTRNGQPWPVRSITCPERNYRPLSTVLSMDISGSMAGANLLIAQTIATEWVNAMDADGSECAIMSFNHQNSFVHDFSADRVSLQAAINALTSRGGTSYDAALIDTVYGALRVMRAASQKRIVIVVTDGVGLLQRSAEIIREAQSQGCAIYAVMIKGDVSASLDSVALATGGISISNVNTVADARRAFAMIRFFAERNGRCRVTWEEEAQCRSVDPQISIGISYRNRTDTRIYRPRPENVIALRAEPPFLAFGKRTPNVSHDTTVVLTASVRDITILGVSNSSSQPVFTIVDPLPLTIRPGQPRTIRVRCRPADSSRVYERLTLILDSCAAQLSATCGYKGGIVSNSSLRILGPNGGERFVAGEDTVVTWTGLTESDSVRVEISRDGGGTWSDLARSAAGLAYRWAPVNGPPAPSCLVRVTQYETGSTGIQQRIDVRYDGTESRFSDCVWAEDDATLVGVGDSTAATNGLVARFRNDQATALRRTTIGTNEISSVDLRRDGGIVTGGAGGDGYVSLFDPLTLALVRRITRHFAGVSSVAVAPSDTLVASGCDDGTVRISSITSGTIRHTIGERNVSPAVTTVRWTPDGIVMAFGDVQGSVTAWDALGSRVVRRMDIHTPGSRVNEIDIHPNSVAMASVGSDSTIAITNVLTGTPLKVTRRFPDELRSVAWSPDGSLIAVVESNSFVHVLDASTLFTLATIPTSFLRARRVRWSPSGAFLSIAGATGIEIWSLRSEPLQQDVSDAPFTIVAPWPVGRDVDMRRVVAGMFRDSVITNAVRNAGSYPFRVDTVLIRGADAAAFDRVSGGVRSRVEAGTDHAIEMRFRPLRVGAHRADLVIVTSSDTLVHTIRGDGVAAPVVITPSVIDMGDVPIGTRRDSARAIRVRNVGNGTVRVRQITALGPDPARFSIGGNFPQMIPAGGLAEFDVSFIPLSTSRTNCVYEVGVEVDGAPYTVQIIGRGTVDGARIDAQAPSIALRCEADTVDTVRITNTGTRDLVVQRAVFAGPHAFDYAVQSTFPIVVPPGTTSGVAFLFEPSAPGVRSAVMSITNTSADSVLTVPIDARKDSGTAVFVGTPIDVGVVCPGTVIDTAVFLANPGNVDVAVDLTGAGITPISGIVVPASDTVRVALQVAVPAAPGPIAVSVNAVDAVCGFTSTFRITGAADTSVLRMPLAIDLGSVCDDAPVPFTLLITNASSASVTAELASGPNIDAAPSSTLLPRSATVVPFTWNARGRIGTVVDTIAVRDGSCGFVHLVVVNAEIVDVRVRADVRVDIGVFPVGTLVRDTLELANVGVMGFRVPSPQGITTPIALVDVTPPVGTVLDPGQTARAVIDVLVPFGTDSAQVEWPIVDPCALRVSQVVRWTGVTSTTVRTGIRIDDVSGAAGERRTLRMVMRVDDAIDRSNIPTRYRAEIRVNASCLVPTDPQWACTAAPGGECAFEIEGQRQTSDTLASIPVLITLGTTDRSPLRITSFTWTDAVVTTLVETTDGTLRVEGVCEEGGVRLFVPSGVALSCAIRPNPATDVIDVQYGTVEPGPVSMDIIDIAGRVIRSPLTAASTVAGVYVLNVDVSTIPNGVYFLRLTLPSDVLVTRFDIVR